MPDNGFDTLIEELLQGPCMVADILPEQVPAEAGGQYAAQVHTYDYTGHLISEEYYTADGEPLMLGGGYAAVVYGYDAAGNITSIAYFNAVNEPALVGGYAKVVRKYDENHNMIREAFYGADLRPTTLPEGYSARTMTYDPVTGYL